MVMSVTRLLARTGLVLAAALPFACSAQAPEPSVTRAQAAISGGEPDSADSNVFLVVAQFSSEEYGLCSASLIAPNLLLTARHCVSTVSSEQVDCNNTSASAPLATNTFIATNSESINGPLGSVFEVKSIAVPSQSSLLCGFDLALITLSKNVPASTATPLVPRIDRAVARNEVYRAVGYGQVMPGDGGVAGNRMGRTGLRVECAPGNCEAGVETTEFQGQAGICSGDSGGPALDAAGKVVGVVSRSASDCENPVYGSVASWKDWIIGVAQEAAAQGGYQPPFWVTTGVSDPPAADAGEAGASGSSTSSPSVIGDQGDKCGAPSDCLTGYGCYSPDSQATNAYCAAYCNSSASCADGTHCDTGIGVCVAGAASAATRDSSSCAIRAPGGKRAPAGAALLALAAALVVSRRRARRASAR